jgi:hypothetical protein
MASFTCICNNEFFIICIYIMENNHVDHVTNSDTFTSEKLLLFYTVKSVYKGHWGAAEIMPFIISCPLYAG